jgi:hypothetical protein
MPQTYTITEKDILVELTLHNMSAVMLKEFVLKIVKPYFGGNMNKAIRSLMEKAVKEEKIVSKADFGKQICIECDLSNY